jgi:hypothetical protein
LAAHIVFILIFSLRGSLVEALEIAVTFFDSPYVFGQVILYFSFRISQVGVRKAPFSKTNAIAKDPASLAMP